MKILYLSQYFPPEIGATQTRAYEMAKNLVMRGHDITVMTEVPNHPSGIIPPRYRGCFHICETYDGIPVVRSWVYATPIKTFRTRMAFYLSYAATTVLNSFFLKNKDFDLVYATSPPLFAGIAGLIISKIKQIPFVFEVRDLWPESAVDLNQISQPALIKGGHAVANLFYRHSKAIISVTQGIYDRLLEKGVPREKVFLIKNGTNPERFRYCMDTVLQEKLNWKNKFIVLYAGIHGIAQGMDTILNAAENLKHRSDIHFACIGDGPYKGRLMELAKQKKLSNVEFLPEVPSDLICRYISLADVCLVPLKKIKLFQGAFPSKMFDAWACGKPIILSVDGEARRELERAEGGIYVEPENPLALSKAILEGYNNPEKLRQMGENGKKFIYTHGYIRAHQAACLEKILAQVVAHKPESGGAVNTIILQGPDAGKTAMRNE